MAEYVASDTHFGHKNIIKYCNRPFQSVSDMNAHMMSQWNLTVKDDDDIYFLGDFSFGDGHTFFDKLSGRKHLVKGNHDPQRTLSLGWKSVREYTELKRNGKFVILFHYPIEEWNGKYHGAVHLHGHCHGNRGKISAPGRLDMGVDCWKFTPVKLDEAIKIAEESLNG